MNQEFASDGGYLDRRVVSKPAETDQNGGQTGNTGEDGFCDRVVCRRFALQCL